MNSTRVSSKGRRALRAAAAAGFLLAAAGCSQSKSVQAPVETATPPPTTTNPTPRVTDVLPAIVQGGTEVGLTPISTGMTAPLAAAPAPGIKGHLFVADQTGQIWDVELTSGNATMFADTSTLLVKLGLPSLGNYDERGLLGFAFHPDFASNGLFYTYTSEPVSGTADFTFPTGGPACANANPTGPDHQNVVREWKAQNPAGPAFNVSTNSRVVLRIDWPSFNHNGGALVFGPDRMLYVSTGDGGGEDDQLCQQNFDGTFSPGHSSPNGNGQDPTNIYGKVLRIDPNGRTAKNGQYAVPGDNPFLQQSTTLPEIWALGLRNPWRMSFDTPSGTLIGGDVGNNDVEEVNFLRAGLNYGWRVKEGTFLFDPADVAMGPAGTDGKVTQDSPGSPSGLTDPVAEYAHFNGANQQGQAVIGGFVYHGTLVPELKGTYVFGDYSGTAGTPAGRLLAISNFTDLPLTGGALDPNAYKTHPVVSLTAQPLDRYVLGIAQDADGELYVLGNTTGIPSGNTGTVARLSSGKQVTPPAAPAPKNVQAPHKF